jgi:hypothetical protein
MMLERYVIKNDMKTKKRGGEQAKDNPKKSVA